MSEMIEAPWTPEVVDALNRAQRSPMIHPYTCGRRTDGNHVERDGLDLGALTATENGWVCEDCDYTQNWAWDTSVVLMGPVFGHPDDGSFLTNLRGPGG